MAFSLAAATGIVASGGHGFTKGFNEHGGVVVLAPGRLTVEQISKSSANRVVRVEFVEAPSERRHEELLNTKFGGTGK